MNASIIEQIMRDKGVFPMLHAQKTKTFHLIFANYICGSKSCRKVACHQCLASFASLKAQLWFTVQGSDTTMMSSVSNVGKQ